MRSEADIFFTLEYSILTQQEVIHDDPATIGVSRSDREAS